MWERNVKRRIGMKKIQNERRQNDRVPLNTDLGSERQKRTEKNQIKVSSFLNHRRIILPVYRRQRATSSISCFRPWTFNILMQFLPSTRVEDDRWIVTCLGRVYPQGLRQEIQYFPSPSLSVSQLKRVITESLNQKHTTSDRICVPKTKNSTCWVKFWISGPDEHYHFLANFPTE